MKCHVSGSSSPNMCETLRLIASNAKEVEKEKL